MFSACRKRWLREFALLLIVPALLGADAPGRVLRVAADPNNLPFSNERREGFENRLVELIARELNATIEYTWWAQRRGFFRNNFKEGNCDLVAGVPEHFDPLLTTAPYYRSTYVIVSRTDRRLDIRALDDPALRHATIGVQMTVMISRTLRPRMRSRAAGSSGMSAGSRCTVTIAKPAHPRGSSPPSRTGMWMSPSPGDRWLATSSNRRAFP